MPAVRPVARDPLAAALGLLVRLGQRIEAPVRAELPPGSPVEVIEQALAPERLRVRPQFNGTHYDTPTYCQLAHTCAEETKRGADDESEMGVFHDLFQPQREANLRARLDEYTPAGMETGIIYAS
jgi:hypothetical protein